MSVENIWSIVLLFCTIAMLVRIYFQIKEFKNLKQQLVEETEKLEKLLEIFNRENP